MGYIHTLGFRGLSGDTAGKASGDMNMGTLANCIAHRITQFVIQFIKKSAVKVCEYGEDMIF